MTYRMRPAERAFSIANYAILSVLVLAMLYPFWFVLVASFSDPDYVQARGGLQLLVHGPTLVSYKVVLRNPNVLTGYRNTLLYLAVGIAVNMSLTILGAYGLSRRQFLGKRLIMGMIVFTMVFSGGLIPLYMIVRGLGMINRLWAIVIPSALNTYNMIIMRTAFQGVPVSLEESARIDGAGDLRIMLSIVVPLSAPVIAVVALYYAVAQWNSFFAALIYLRDRVKYPLQLVLREVLFAQQMDEMMMNAAGTYQDKISLGLRDTVKYATIVVSTVPILVLYPYLQRYFVKGIMIGSLKE